MTLIKCTIVGVAAVMCWVLIMLTLATLGGWIFGVHP